MNYLKRPKLLISAAWLLHIMAWFLPVIKDGARLPSGLPGWEAFRAASSVFYSRSEFKDWYFAVIAGTGSVTTLLFLFGSPFVVLRGSHRLTSAAAWAASVAFVVNAQWYILDASERGAYMIGYLFWCLSFAVLAAGLFDLARQRSRIAVSKSAGRLS